MQLQLHTNKTPTRAQSRTLAHKFQLHCYHTQKNTHNAVVRHYMSVRVSSSLPFKKKNNHAIELRDFPSHAQVHLFLRSHRLSLNINGERLQRGALSIFGSSISQEPSDFTTAVKRTGCAGTQKKVKWPFTSQKLSGLLQFIATPDAWAPALHPTCGVGLPAPPVAVDWPSGTIFVMCAEYPSSFSP